ncbi:LysR family transcriptional regulator [Microbacterium sp. XT11]|uniref:LysR family transcriptional regulator n=1 Tax=Microbacterium sp. XT11 TaxID=367477 RepID=UPI000742E704|nr:LysR family transcriptional regulator [Microbacterium sp. XT11]ALX67101.1 LysR family transcriptional regulator [Microbacterium sp. XT11]
MDDVEIRELRYFVTVAEELHFGRAAERLHIAQPALSKAVQRLEMRLGIRLFARTSRTVALTPAGEALLQHGRHAISAMRMAVQAARQAGGAEPLRLAMKPGGDAGLLSDLLGEYATHPGATEVDILFHSGAQRAELVRSGQADAALLYTPFEAAEGLRTVVLHVEDRVAVLRSDHRLATRASLTTSDLDGEASPRWEGAGDGAEGPAIATVAELVPLVRLGRVVAVLPRSLVGLPPEGIACVPVSDAGRSSIVIGCRRNDTRESVAALMRAAEAMSAPASSRRARRSA